MSPSCYVWSCHRFLFVLSVFLRVGLVYFIKPLASILRMFKILQGFLSRLFIIAFKGGLFCRLAIECQSLIDSCLTQGRRPFLIRS